MRLLPIIIVMSLLAFFVTLTISIFVVQYLRNPDRRKRQRPIAGGNEKPTRQLTVRSGKVVPRAEAMQTASTRHLESLDVSSLGSGYSSKVKVTMEKPSRSTPQTKRSERRHSAYTDLEAQENALEKQWEENMKAFHVDQRFMESWKAINSRSNKTERTRPVPESQLPAISGQRIAESLRKGYNGPSALSGQPVDVPAALLSKPAKAYTLSRKTTNDSGIMPPSKAQEGDIAPEHIPPSNRHQKEKSDINPNDHPPKSPRVSFVLPKAIQIPLSVHAASVHSPYTRTESPIHNTPVSFFSTSESPASSAISQVTPSLVNAPPPSPTDMPSSQTLRPHEVDGTPQRTPSTQSRRNKPLEIDTNIPNLSDTSFIDSADSSEKNASDRPRGQSVMSNHSVLTFASSELSSIWTFGNAQPVAIVAGVTPRTLAMHPHAMRPKSKFGRRLKSRKEKALPVIPKSPLRLESSDVS